MKTCDKSWCATACLGVEGPGAGAKLGLDYVIGFGFELYCSPKCRDIKCPIMAGLPGDFDQRAETWSVAPWRYR